MNCSKVVNSNGNVTTPRTLTHRGQGRDNVGNMSKSGQPWFVVSKEWYAHGRRFRSNCVLTCGTG